MSAVQLSHLFIQVGEEDGAVVVRAKNCTRLISVDGQRWCSTCSSLKMDTINQRAERQLLSLGKVELFNTSLNGTPLPPLFQAALRKDVPKAGKAAAGKATWARRRRQPAARPCRDREVCAVELVL